MSLIKTIGVLILSILLITTLTVFVLLIGFHELLQKETYISSFQKNNFYSYIDKILIDSKIKDIIIIDNSIEFFINNKIDNFLSYVKGNSEELDLKIRVNNSKMIEKLTSDYEKMPECNINNLQDKNLKCRIPGVDSKEFIEQTLKSQKIEFNEETEIDLKKSLNIDEWLIKQKELRRYYTFYLILFYGTLLVSLVLVLVILVLNIFNLKSSFRSFGMILFIVGLNSIVFSTVFISTLTSQGDQMMANDNQASMIFFNVFKDIMLTVSDKIKLIGIISLAIGISLFVISLLIKKK